MKLERDLTCAELVELVTDYHEGALSQRDLDRFEEHLVFCSSCLNYVEQMRQTIESVGSLREEDLSPQLQGALLEAFRDWKRT
jgi:predicted anti-sigma-YlaC factor YlaD